jgi:signal peptidase I
MLQKRIIDDMKTQGRLQRINPFKEIDGKEYNKKYYNKQKELLEKYSKEIQQGNKYLEEFSNINDETGLKRAYNNKTDLGLYHHPENKTLYIAGTKDFPRDILDDTLIPFHMVHRSKRYKTANDFIRNNIDNVDTIVSHSLGSATTMKLNQDYNKRFTTRTYGTPGDPVSMFDRGVDITVNKNSYNPLYNHGFHAVHFGDMGKSEKNVAEPINKIM